MSRIGKRPIPLHFTAEGLYCIYICISETQNTQLQKIKITTCSSSSEQFSEACWNMAAP